MRNVFIVFFISLLICVNAFAADLFTVDGIKVSSSGESAKKAKDTAVLTGQQEAFVKLIGRISSSTPPNFVLNIDPSSLSDMVQGVEVHDEKITANYYSATLNISFNRSFIERFLRDNNIKFTDVKSPPIVVIPLLVGEDGEIQFESSHPWRRGLVQFARASHVLDIKILRSLRSVDKTMLDPKIENIMPEILDSLLKVGNSYDAQKLIIAIAAKDFEDPAQLNVRLRDIMDKDGEIRDMSFKPEKSFNEDGEPQNGEDVFESASRSVITLLENQWVRRQVESNVPLAKISVTVPIYSIEHWTSLRKKIENLDFLKEATVKAITVKYALVEISFKDTFENIIAKMNKSGFYFENTGDAIILHAMRKR